MVKHINKTLETPSNICIDLDLSLPRRGYPELATPLLRFPVGLEKLKPLLYVGRLYRHVVHLFRALDRVLRCGLLYVSLRWRRGQRANE